MAARSSGKYRMWLRPFRHWWRPLAWIWGALILGIIINDGSSWLISKSFDVSDTPLGWLIGHPGIIFPLIGGLILLTSLAGLAHRQEDALIVQGVQRLELPPQQRLQVLRSLHLEYEDKLAHSLQGSIVLDLELHNRTDMVVSSASLVFHDLEAGEASPLPRGTSILQAYDRVQRGLLILGAPGSGKTTLLLTLARDLLHRAENEPDHPLVIILNLSSWARTQLPLVQWLGEQCALVYGIPKRLTAAWIEQEQVQFLLDGLDEMGASARTACIETINTYRQAHLVPLVVCSRSQEYETQPAHLILPAAVEIQPLELAQVSHVLKQAGKSLAAVRAALRTNVTLQQLLTTPLMLNIVLLTYRGKTAKELPQMGTSEQQQRQIFAQYVQHMLHRSQQHRIFSSAQTSFFLVWLAQQMQRCQVTEFHLELLQVNWLSTKRARLIYQLFSRLIMGLLFGLVGGLLVELVFGYLNALLLGPISWLLLLPLFSAPLFFGVGFGWPGQPYDIEPVEQIAWSWKASKKGLVAGLGFGTLYGRLFLGLFGWLLGGFSGVPPIKNERFKPNQGIHSSGWNALRLGLIFFLFTGLLFGLPFSLRFGLFIGLLFFLLAGLFGGLFAGLYFGGIAYCQHYMLRFLLAHSRVFPWRVVPFLEEAQRHILLQRVGGGYRFVHPLLQEYFASLTTQ